MGIVRSDNASARADRASARADKSNVRPDNEAEPAGHASALLNKGSAEADKASARPHVKIAHLDWMIARRDKANAREVNIRSASSLFESNAADRLVFRRRRAKGRFYVLLDEPSEVNNTRRFVVECVVAGDPLACEAG